MENEVKHVMKVKVGVVGYSFARDFTKLFSLHPDVEKICVAELKEELRIKAKEEHPDAEIYSSYDEMLEKSDINSVAIFTQRHLHGPMVIKALEAGKNVYSAVPIGCTIDEIEQIVRLVEKKRLIYMMGETCYYYPSAIFCREKYKEGAFGKFVYAEAQYYHDTREMYPDYQRSGGANWRRVAGIPPMFYPTHSIAMVLPALEGQYLTRVSCMGLRDDYPDEIFGEELNDFQNPFSNETAIFRLSGGGVLRINEFRRVGINKPSTYITCFYGENGAYDSMADKHYLQTAPLPDRDGKRWPMHLEDVSEQLLPYDYTRLKKGEIQTYYGREWNDSTSPVSVCAIQGSAPIQDVDRLPDSFKGATNGAHFASHPFLIDDFVRAVVTHKLPPNNVWDAARYMVPGLVAHESALQGGKLLDIPDFGGAPEDWEKLTYEEKKC